MEPEHIITVFELIDALQHAKPDAPVMLALGDQFEFTELGHWLKGLYFSDNYIVLDGRIKL